jgi:hypothetical protein
MNVSRRVESHNESRVGGACGPPPPFTAPLVPRCALTSGATPRDELSRRLRLGTSQRQVATPRFRHHARCRRPLSEITPPHAESPTAEAEPPTARAESPTVENGTPRERYAQRVTGEARSAARLSTSRGVAPEVSAQRGTSGAVNGGGGPQAPPTRLLVMGPQAARIRLLVMGPQAARIRITSSVYSRTRLFERWGCLRAENGAY